MEHHKGSTNGNKGCANGRICQNRQNDAQNIEENAKDGEAVSEDSNSDSDEQTLIALWRRYKESNPEGTLDDFYKDVSVTNSEVE
jgi:hypothetical protein